MLKLDVGAGEISPPGFVPIGRGHGTEIYPLPYPDGSIEEVRASHCLEHVPHNHIEIVVADWVRVLKKGGRLRIAVPDFAKIAESYLRGEKAPHESWLLGGQTDVNDFHKSMFDRDRLRQLLAKNDLVLIKSWKSEIEDCAAYEISLNLEGYKPHVPEMTVCGAMSVPRFGPLATMFCALEAAIACKVKFSMNGGAFWGQSLTKTFERIIEQDNADAILAVDYDSLFQPKHLAHLIQLMMLYPEADALAPVQSSRHVQTALFTVQGPDGKNRPRILRTDFDGEISPIATAHFGLTLLRTEKLKALPKPWFHSIPSPNGDWGEGSVDEDISFWHKWTDAGNSLYLANRVAIGHIEEIARWPDINLQTLYQPIKEFREKGAPDGAWK